MKFSTTLVLGCLVVSNLGLGSTSQASLFHIEKSPSSSLRTGEYTFTKDGYCKKAKEIAEIVLESFEVANNVKCDGFNLVVEAHPSRGLAWQGVYIEAKKLHSLGYSNRSEDTSHSTKLTLEETLLFYFLSKLIFLPNGSELGRPSLTSTSDVAEYYYFELLPV